MTSKDQNPQQRPRPDEVRPSASGIVDQIRENATSIRQALALSGTAGIILGGLLWIFIRDLAGPALIVVAIGLALIVVDIAISRKSVRDAVFGKGGRFGLNSITILLTVITIAVVINSVLFWATHRPSPMGFLEEICKRPKNERAYLLIPIGYPAEDTKIPDLRKKVLKEYAEIL